LFHTGLYLALGGAIALELIRDDHTGGVLAPLQELAEECLRGPLVTARLDEEIQHMPVLIHRAPEGMPLAIDGEAHVSMGHVSPSLGRRRRSCFAYECPHVRHHCRIASYVTATPRATSSSSTSR
jgi:hypothetical protein